MRSLVLCLACAACIDPAEPIVAETSHVSVHDYPGHGPTKADVLFIIDDTTAMAPYLNRLATLPHAYAAAFATIDGGFVDTHIAVATTTNSELRRLPAVGGSFMTIRTELDLDRITNFLGSLEDTFGLLADVGATSSAANRPLDVLRRVVEENPDGLIRDDAYLNIVIITASDDVSSESPATYAELAKSAKARPEKVFVSAITVMETPRLHELFAALPNRHKVTSLADGDYTSALAVFGTIILSIIPGQCWHVSDVDPITPGPQYDCTFTATIRGAQRLLPPCKLPTDVLCWSLVPSDNECSPDVGTVKPSMPPYRFFTFTPPFRAECTSIH